jgi:hypothetical protein
VLGGDGVSFNAYRREKPADCDGDSDGNQEWNMDFGKNVPLLRNGISTLPESAPNKLIKGRTMLGPIPSLATANGT